MTTFVAAEGLDILGMYKFRANQRDLGSHVANASFMVSPAAHGRGVGKAMGQHCLMDANGGLCGHAVQFRGEHEYGRHLVVEEVGFSIVGTVPKAFKHQQLGYVDVHVMYRSLKDG